MNPKKYVWPATLCVVLVGIFGLVNTGPRIQGKADALFGMGNQVDETTYLIYAAGGYNSCANLENATTDLNSIPNTSERERQRLLRFYLTRTAARAAEYVIEPLMEQNANVVWFVSCFWGVQSTQLKLRASDSPDDVERWNWRNTNQGAGYTNMFYDDLSGRILEQLVGLEGNIKMIFIGHSNGGYTVLKLAEALLDSLFIPQKIQEEELDWYIATLDPINTNCNPSSIAFGHADCYRAPTDIDYGRLRQNGIVMHNWYQDDYSNLHSGPINHPGVANTDVNGLRSTWTENQHSLVSGHRPAFETIQVELILEGLMPENTEEVSYHGFGQQDPVFPEI